MRRFDASKLPENAKLVPGWIRFPLILGVFALLGYNIYSHTGLYGLLSDLQADLFHKRYYPFLSALLSLIVYLLPVLVFVHSLVPYYRRRREDHTDLLDRPER